MATNGRFSPLDLVRIYTVVDSQLADFCEGVAGADGGEVVAISCKEGQTAVVPGRNGRLPQSH